MKKVIAGAAACMVLSTMATMALAQAPSWGSALKSVSQAAGQALVQQMTPQAQAALAQANKLGAGAPQENFLVTKAREYMAAGNYQTALDLANYVITALNSRSVDAKKIMADARAALTKMAQEKLAQAQPEVSAAAGQGQAKVDAARGIAADASQTVSGVKSLFGAQK